MIKVFHKFLGEVFITEQTVALQALNPDPNSIYVYYPKDDRVIEVSKALVSEEQKDETNK